MNELMELERQYQQQSREAPPRFTEEEEGDVPVATGEPDILQASPPPEPEVLPAPPPPSPPPSHEIKQCTIESLPQEFGIIVVVGASGSGKTTRLRALAKHFGLLDVFDVKNKWEEGKAIVSHPGFAKGEKGQTRVGIDMLSCMGFRSVKAWIRPYEALSRGEQIRSESALRLARGDGAVIDDYAATVTDLHAASMAISLQKLVRKKRIKRVLLATTKAGIVPYLGADFISFTSCGSDDCMLANPWDPLLRTPAPIIRGTEDLVFKRDVKTGWESISGTSADDDPVLPLKAPEDEGAGPRRETYVEEYATDDYEKQCKVQFDIACVEVTQAFDFELQTRQHLRAVLAEALPRSYALGAIVGPCGCGKTSALEYLLGYSLPPALKWNKEQTVLAQISEQQHGDAESLLEAMALPQACWQLPFHQLSSTERVSAEVARRLAFKKGPICLDEFTSAADRHLAHRMCRGLATLLRRRAAEGRPLRRILIASVHEDILQWLLPDWVFYPHTGELLGFDGPEPTEEDVAEATSAEPAQVMPSMADSEQIFQLLCPRAPELVARHCQDSKWIYQQAFAEHQYQDEEIPLHVFCGVMARCEGQPVAFQALTTASGFLESESKVTMRENRLVVRPDFQGFGIGPQFSNLLGDRLLASGMRLVSQTHHPRLGESRENSRRWRPTTRNRIQDSFSESRREQLENEVHWEEPEANGDDDDEHDGRRKYQKRHPITSVWRPYRHQYIGDTADGNDSLLPPKPAKPAKQKRPAEVEEVVHKPLFHLKSKAKAKAKAKAKWSAKRRPKKG